MINRIMFDYLEENWFDLVEVKEFFRNTKPKYHKFGRIKLLRKTELEFWDQYKEAINKNFPMVLLRNIYDNNQNISREINKVIIKLLLLIISTFLQFEQNQESYSNKYFFIKEQYFYYDLIKIIIESSFQSQDYAIFTMPNQRSYEGFQIYAGKDIILLHNDVEPNNLNKKDKKKLDTNGCLSLNTKQKEQIIKFNTIFLEQWKISLENQTKEIKNAMSQYTGKNTYKFLKNIEEIIILTKDKKYTNEMQSMQICNIKKQIKNITNNMTNIVSKEQLFIFKKIFLCIQKHLKIVGSNIIQTFGGSITRNRFHSFTPLFIFQFVNKIKPIKNFDILVSLLYILKYYSIDYYNYNNNITSEKVLLLKNNKVFHSFTLKDDSDYKEIYEKIEKIVTRRVLWIFKLTSKNIEPKYNLQKQPYSLQMATQTPLFF